MNSKFSKFSKLISLLHRSRAEEGQAMVMVAISLVVILGFGAFAVDIGHVAVVKSDLQNAADAAALAGAADLSNNTATQTAVSYAALNGMKATANNVMKDGDTVTVTTPFELDASKIEVVCERKVQYYFAGVLGFKETVVTARAVAQKTGETLPNSTFGYAVFVGDDKLKWNGGDFIIDGDVYGDEGVTFTGNGTSITGSVVYNKGSVSIKNFSGSPIKKAETLPDFSQLVKDQAMANGNYFTNQASFKSKYYDWPAVPAVPATPAVLDKKGRVIVPANPGSPAIPAKTGAEINGAIWVHGDLEIDKPLRGNGIIYSDGDFEYSYNEAGTNSMASICFYAEEDITFNGGSGKISGILYAPNGEVTINGTPKDNKIYGRMIAQDVTVNGNGYTVISRDSDLDWLDTLPTSSTYKLIQ